MRIRVFALPPLLHEWQGSKLTAALRMRAAFFWARIADRRGYFAGADGSGGVPLSLAFAGPVDALDMVFEIGG